MVGFLDKGKIPTKNPNSGKLFGVRGNIIEKQLTMLNNMVVDSA